MAIVEEVVINSIDVLEDGQIQVRQATRIIKDGVQIAEAYHRHVVHPGMDLTNEDRRVRDVAGVIHTPEVIAAFDVKQAQNRAADGD